MAHVIIGPSLSEHQPCPISNSPSLPHQQNLVNTSSKPAELAHTTHLPKIRRRRRVTPSSPLLYNPRSYRPKRQRIQIVTQVFQSHLSHLRTRIMIALSRSATAARPVTRRRISYLMLIPSSDHRFLSVDRRSSLLCAERQRAHASYSFFLDEYLLWVPPRLGT